MRLSEDMISIDMIEGRLDLRKLLLVVNGFLGGDVKIYLYCGW